VLPIDNNISLMINPYPYHLIYLDYELHILLETFASYGKVVLAHNFLRKTAERELSSSWKGLSSSRFLGHGPSPVQPVPTSLQSYDCSQCSQWQRYHVNKGVMQETELVFLTHPVLSFGQMSPHAYRTSLGGRKV
jgi:hypothetical protein